MCLFKDAETLLTTNCYITYIKLTYAICFGVLIKIEPGLPSVLDVLINLSLGLPAVLNISCTIEPASVQFTVVSIIIIILYYLYFPGTLEAT